MAVKSDTERGLWGAWARRERLSREWSADEVAQRVEREAGVKMDVATLRGIEGGSKKPSVRLQDALALVFGSRPKGTDRPVEDGQSDVAAAIERQTTVLEGIARTLSELVGALTLRDESTIVAQVVAELRATVPALSAPGVSIEPPARAVPRRGRM